jgi:Alpha-galactosidases/6-phospho-beta-glucosidases, family 4 of glycosyl hydrolases
MTKIVIVGGGSGFGGKLSKDILALPELRDCHLVLVDINEQKLAAVTRYVQRIVEAYQLPARVEGTTDRRAALPGADFVVTSISVGGPAYAGFPSNVEVEIPRKYGVEQSVADTIGVGGIFRFLRTGPVQLAVCRDMEELCPDALLLNYTNPMCMLTWLHSAETGIANVGLCHSVQHTVGEMAGYLGIPKNEVTYLCAGINHQAWYLRLRHQGEDLYPRLRACLDDPEIVAKDTVRFAFLKHFGWFVTESTRHCSEYHPYFRRNDELLAKYGLNKREVAKEEKLRDYLADPDGVPLPDLSVSVEYAARIIEAALTDSPFRFNGNVMNTGLIDNLPADCCVEVPCLVDAEGVHPCHVGRLPTQLAALNQTNVVVQELAVQAVRERDREAAFHACLLDPLTRSVCDLDATRAMFDELWEAEGPLLSDWFGK